MDPILLAKREAIIRLAVLAWASHDLEQARKHLDALQALVEEETE